MVARKRHLRGADQVQVVTFEAVYFVVVFDVEPGSVHDFGAHEGGGCHHGEAVGCCQIERHPHERLFQTGNLPFEEVKARAGDLGATCHVDTADEFAYFQVVARFKTFCGEIAGGADFFEHHKVVFAAGGYAVDNQVFDGA